MENAVLVCQDCVKQLFILWVNQLFKCGHIRTKYGANPSRHAVGITETKTWTDNTMSPICLMQRKKSAEKLSNIRQGNALTKTFCSSFFTKKTCSYLELANRMCETSKYYRNKNFDRQHDVSNLLNAEKKRRRKALRELANRMCETSKSLNSTAAVLHSWDWRICNMTDTKRRM